MTKFLSWLVTLPVILIAVSFAISNRGVVTVSLWPFGLEVEAPLFLLTLGTLFLGILFGAFVMWLSLLRHQLAAGRLGKKLAGMEKELSSVRSDLAKTGKP